jgi:glucokinase
VYVGIDLGGTNFRVGVREADRETLANQEWAPASGCWGAEEIGEQVTAMLASLCGRRPGAQWEIASAGFGLTGDIDPRTGTCYSMIRFPRLEGAALGPYLEEKLQVPVFLLNDGLTAALAELRAGAGKGVGSFVMITLGTGIGGGIVVDGKLLTGSRGRIGKVGHQIIDLDGPVHCHCGLPGCWQTLAGKEGIVARARTVSASRPQSALAGLVHAGDVDLQQVAVLAEGGDPASRLVVEETGRYVGVGLANLVKIFAPERVIIGGGIAEENRLLLQTAQETVDEYAIKPYQRVPLVPARFGKDAGVVGATFLHEESL